MVKCVNEQCENHGKKIKGNLELCPVCGTPTEKYVAPVKTELGVGAVIASLAGILVFMSYSSLYITGPFISIAGIVVAFISKSKPCIVLSFLSLAAIVGLFVHAVF